MVRLPGRVAVRKPPGPRNQVLHFTLPEWAEFIDRVKRNPSPAPMGRVGFPNGQLHLPPVPPRALRRLPPPYVDEDPPF